MDSLLGGRKKWTTRRKRAVCAAGSVGEEVGNGCTAGWEREVDC